MKNRINARLIHKLLAWAMALLAGAQVVLILVSWLITAAMPDIFVHSLLSAEGIRWFFGGFVDLLASRPLVYLLLVSIASGSVLHSGILRYDRHEYRHRVAIRVVVAELVLFVLVMLALTLVPHAILLNVMGGVMDSSFSKSLLAYVCFAILVMSLTFGMMSNRLRGLVDVCDATCYGIRLAAPLFVVYVLMAQLFGSIMYLFLTA